MPFGRSSRHAEQSLGTNRRGFVVELLRFFLFAIVTLIDASERLEPIRPYAGGSCRAVFSCVAFGLISLLWQTPLDHFAIR